MNFVVSGKRAKVSVNTTQASGSAVATTTVSTARDEGAFWTTSRKIGAAVVGAATIAGAIFAAIQAF